MLMRLRDKTAGILRGLALLEEVFLCLLLTGMIALACFQIVMRFFFSGGYIWADPLLRYMVLWAGMFGAAVATRKGKHISIDIISHLLPDKIQPYLSGAINLFSATVCAFLAYASIVFVRNEAEFGGTRIFDIPAWQINLVFPIVFSLIAIRFLLNTILVGNKPLIKSFSHSADKTGSFTANS